MKKYIFFIIGLTIIDIAVSMLVSTQLLTLQKEYGQLRQREKELRQQTDQLAREVAHMASLQKISQSAQNLGLTKTDNRVVYVEKAAFAAVR